MDKYDEKKYIYEQMRLIIEERRRLTELYYDLKKKLNQLDNDSNDEQFNLETSKSSKIDLKKESEIQRYMTDRSIPKKIASYQQISLTIASILKESQTPLRNQEIYSILKEKGDYQVSMKNLSVNILPRMNKDKHIPVERAYRGYWQYRLH